MTTIKVDPRDPDRIEVVHAYSQQVDRIFINRNDRMLSGLRRLMCHPRGMWAYRREGERIIFSHPGRVIKIAGSKSGWVS
jgi:hypothetical protein